MPSLIETKTNFCMVKVLLRLFIFAAAFLLFACKTPDALKASPNLDESLWCLPDSSGNASIILYFKDGYCAEMFGKLNGGFSEPREKIKYEVLLEDDGVKIVFSANPQEPPFVLRGEKLVQTWPMGKGSAVFERISAKDANAFLKYFKVSDIDFKTLKAAR